MRILEQREVQVLGKPVGFKEAFLQARATLEQPGIARLRVLPERGQHPAQRVILLHDMRFEAEVLCQIEQLLLWNHRAFQPSGSESRHAVTNFRAGCAGSNCE